MTLLLSLFAVSAGLTARVGITLVTVQELRNPCTHGWIKSNFVVQAASLVLVAIIAGALAWAMASMMEAVGVTVALIFGTAIFNWRVFRFGERLRRADAGHSPFEHLHAKQKPQRTPAAYS